MFRASSFGFLILLLAFAAPAFAQSKNLIANGNFEKGEKDGEPYHWHTKLTSIIPVPEYEDPANKKGRTGKVNFKCGCGYDWGTVRPWTNLVCPQCRRVNTGLEDSGNLYLDNEKYVKVAAGKSGKAAAFKYPSIVGNNEGVRCISELMKARRGQAYEIQVDVASGGGGATSKVIVEGFKEEELDAAEKEWLAALPPEANPLKMDKRLRRVFRHVVHTGAPGNWKHFSEQFKAPKRYEFDYFFVTLYGYSGDMSPTAVGENGYDNVVLRPLSKSEQAAYEKENPGPKDKRLREPDEPKSGRDRDQ